MSRSWVPRMYQGLALMTLTISVSLVLGWALGNPTLTSFLPGSITMKANTAAGLGLLAVTSCSRHAGCRPRTSGARARRAHLDALRWS
jgi:hypothetical protein